MGVAFHHQPGVGTTSDYHRPTTPESRTGNIGHQKITQIQPNTPKDPHATRVAPSQLHVVNKDIYARHASAERPVVVTHQQLANVLVPLGDMAAARNWARSLAISRSFSLPRGGWAAMSRKERTWRQATLSIFAGYGEDEDPAWLLNFNIKKDAEDGDSEQQSGHPENTQQLCDELIRLRDDPRAIAEVFRDVEGLRPSDIDADTLFGIIKTLRHHPKEMAAFLRERAKLPSKKELADLLPTVQAEMGEADTATIMSSFKAALNTWPEVQRSKDPDGVLDLFELIISLPDVRAVFAALLNHAAPEDVPKLIGLLKSMAALELNSLSPSTDRFNIFRLVEKISQLNISDGLMDKVTKLTKWLQKITGAPQVSTA